MAQDGVLHLSPHLHAMHASGCLSLTRPTPLSTSQPSSCLSSSSPSSTSATSSSRSSTRRSWKACATPLTTGGEDAYDFLFLHAVVPLEWNLHGHPLAGLLWERQFEKILLKHGWEKISNWECLFVHREKELLLSVYLDDIKLAGKKQNLDPMWKLLNKEVDLREPTSFLDHVYLGCTQRQCQTSKDTVDNYRTMFESRISSGGVEKLPCSENLCIFFLVL